MDKLFDAALANVIMWSTLICIAFLPKLNAADVEKKLAIMENALTRLRTISQCAEVNITVTRLGDELPRDSEWSFLFIKMDSNNEELRFTIIRG